MCQGGAWGRGPAAGKAGEYGGWSLWSRRMFERSRIAETLRGAREKQGLSREQAATAAGIPLQYLLLLEGEANVRGISDEVYLIPFFRKYARLVGIDAEELLPEFLSAMQQSPGEGTPPIRLAYRDRWAFLWKAAAVVLTIGVAASLLLRRDPTQPTFEEQGVGSPGADSSPSASGPSATALARTSELSPAVGATGLTMMPGGGEGEPSGGAPVAVTTPSPEPTAMPEVVPAGAHGLKILALEEAWLAVAVDDQPVTQHLLRSGESRSWSAGHFSLSVGNAGGIKIWFDGRELPAIGRPGQVVRNLRLPDVVPLPSPLATRTEQ